MDCYSSENFHRLSLDASRIRNFCMVAHVDHGKTTLSDYLVASNGVLSTQLAGKVRLLDSRPDEQERMITMKASSIALRHVRSIPVAPPSSTTATEREGAAPPPPPPPPLPLVKQEEYLLHLVDSPGHIDFSCEVSTAIRLCDGALIIVDLVDGVTMQTCSMLRTVYREGLSMVLVLNKIDLLITRQQLTAEEAYYRMRGVIETCNATLASYANQLKIANEYDSLHLDDPSDDVWFCPTKGNVVFSSCFDGWGFTVDTFANIYEAKFSMKHLKGALWGEHYLDAKNKTVVSEPKKAGQPPMALQLILEPIWQLHRAFLEADDVTSDAAIATLSAMVSKIGVDAKVWNRPRYDARQKLGAALAAWLPLAKCVMDTVCDGVRSPIASNRQRLPALMPGFAEAPMVVQEGLLASTSALDAPVVAYISKLIDTQYLAGQTIGAATNSEDNEDDFGFIGFGRVYSGRLKVGQSVFVQSGGGAATTTTGKIRKLYLLRGLGLEEVQEVASGCLCGIGGLTPLITKHATISTRPDVPPFTPLALPSTSIVRLSVHPKDPTQLQALVKGLHILNKVDPQVEISILATGEHVIGTAGEVHAERCVKDLVDTFAKIELVVSEPIVSFRETVEASGGSKVRPVTVKTNDGLIAISVLARPLPREVREIIEEDAANSAAQANLNHVLQRVTTAISTCEEKKKWADALPQGVLAWGTPRYHFLGSLLMTTIAARGTTRAADQHSGGTTIGPPGSSPTTGASEGAALFPQSTSCSSVHSTDDTTHDPSWNALQCLKESLIGGFLLASAAGSMAEEPMFGVAMIITDIEVVGLEGGVAALPALMRDAGATMSGLVMVAMREACRRAVEQPGLGRRLVEPLYHCVVYSAGATQGKVYAILSRRRAEILEEVPNEGSDLFYICCYLPAVEAFGLQDELRIATHGAATAQLQVHKWATVDADPYYKPTTREELEEHGEKMAGHNVATLLLERVRRRKGLHRDLIVESAEKQKFSVKS